MATLVASTLFARVAGLTPCGPSGGASAIIAFEMVRSVDQVMALFGSAPCTARLVAAQRQALWVDMLGFIPAYTAFLAIAAVALRRSGLWLAMTTFTIMLLAGIFDEVEGLVLFRILGAMPGTPELFTSLFWTVRPKFALLGLGEILLAAMLWRGPLLAKVAAGPMLAGGLVSLWFLFTAPLDPTMMKAHSYAWMALLVAALAGSFRPLLVTREGTGA